MLFRMSAADFSENSFTAKAAEAIVFSGKPPQTEGFLPGRETARFSTRKRFSGVTLSFFDRQNILE